MPAKTGEDIAPGGGDSLGDPPPSSSMTMNRPDCRGTLEVRKEARSFVGRVVAVEEDVVEEVEWTLLSLKSLPTGEKAPLFEWL